MADQENKVEATEESCDNLGVMSEREIVKPYAMDLRQQKDDADLEKGGPPIEDAGEEKTIVGVCEGEIVEVEEALSSLVGIGD